MTVYWESLRVLQSLELQLYTKQIQIWTYTYHSNYDYYRIVVVWPQWGEGGWWSHTCTYTLVKDPTAEAMSNLTVPTKFECNFALGDGSQGSSLADAFAFSQNQVRMWVLDHCWLVQILNPGSIAYLLSCAYRLTTCIRTRRDRKRLRYASRSTE